MPELDGFGVLAELSMPKLPAVVFVTAYDQFALKAFEVHAVDYLLKPFDRERFRAALQRAKDRIGSKHGPPAEEGLRALIADLRPEAKSLQKLAVKSAGRVTFVKIDDIDWVEAADNYVNVHAGTSAHLLRETMTSLGARLPPEKFVRINRSTLVNLDRVKELQPTFHGEYCVFLNDGTKLTLSRNYRSALPRLMGTAE